MWKKCPSVGRRVSKVLDMQGCPVGPPWWVRVTAVWLAILWIIWLKSLCLRFLVRRMKINIYIFVPDCQLLPFLSSPPPYPVAGLAAILTAIYQGSDSALAQPSSWRQSASKKKLISYKKNTTLVRSRVEHSQTGWWRLAIYFMKHLFKLNDGLVLVTGKKTAQTTIVKLEHILTYKKRVITAHNLRKDKVHSSFRPSN